MPTRDRYWRVQVAGGVALILLAIIAEIILWFVALSNLRLSDLFDPYLRSLIIVDALGLLLAGGGLLLQGRDSWRAGLRARTRYRMRVAAMNGQPDAAPLVRRDIARGVPADAPDVGGAPLMLTWRATPIARNVMIPILGFFVAVFLAVSGFFVYLIVLVPLTPAVSSLWWGAHLLIYSVLVFTGAVSVSVIGLIVAYMLRFFRLQGIVAADDEITYYSAYRRRDLLRWEDMRLLELAMPQRDRSSNPNTYILHALNGAAEWSERSRNNAFMAFGAPNDELARRQQALLDLIAARTELQPRSCDWELWESAGANQKAKTEDEEPDEEEPDEEEPDEEEPDEEEPDEEGASSKQRVVLLVMGMVSALLVLPGAAAIEFAGLTTSSALNALTAGSLLVAYGITVYAGARSRRRRVPLIAISTVDTTGVAAHEVTPTRDQPSPTDDAHAIYGLVYGATTQTRLGFGVAGLALTLCALPGLSAAIGDQARRYAPASALATLPTVQGTGAHGALASAGMLVLLSLGVIGAMFLAGSLRSGRTVVVADADGLRWRRRRETRRLAWREIVNVEAQMNAGQLENYAATNSGASVTITWYANPYTVRPLTPRDLRRIGAPAQPVQPILPRALAMLVQERSGVALTHDEMTASGFGGRRA